MLRAVDLLTAPNRAGAPRWLRGLRGQMHASTAHTLHTPL